MTQVDQRHARLQRPFALGRRWPSALGLLSAGALVGTAWAGLLSLRQVTAVLAAAGLVYLGSAALGSPRAAWWLFAGTVVVIGLGGRLAIVDPLVTIAVVAVVLLVLGIARGRLGNRSGLPAQIAAMAVVLALAFLAVALPEPWGAVLLAAGLVGHTMWDVAHHRSGRVVPRSMAEFCAVLDPLLAVGVVALAVT
jgi:hypothetical protein